VKGLPLLGAEQDVGTAVLHTMNSLFWFPAVLLQSKVTQFFKDSLKVMGMLKIQ
jgi:hypothetical protein